MIQLQAFESPLIHKTITVDHSNVKKNINENQTEAKIKILVLI